MESIFLKLINRELVYITKSGHNKLISYGCFFDIKLVYSLAWIYKFYFEKNVTLFLPKIINKDTLVIFNETVAGFELSEKEIIYCNLEAIENISLKQNNVFIFGYADFIFHELSGVKRRINTQLKNVKGVIHFLSYTTLHFFDLNILDSLEKYKVKERHSFNFNFMDIFDNDQDIFDCNIEALVDFLVNNDKNVYLSLNIPLIKILQIEKTLKEKGLVVSRKETENAIVINSSKNIFSSFLNLDYSIYIFAGKIENPSELVYYLKEMKGGEVYFDSCSGVDNHLKLISNNNLHRTIIKDSQEFDDYNTMIKDLGEIILVSESYHKFTAPESLLKLDLSNLTKKDHDIIRNFVKLKLNNKFDLDIKTCQMSAPCSPKDRSKKINSLSNKISSVDYRCDVNCEIFKDYTIGVVVWTETITRQSENVFREGIYVYQTTTGKWKFTKVS
jgi:hypothetical protein